MVSVLRILLLALNLAPVLGFAQHPVFRSYTVRDGLSNNAIREVYQDSLGYLWIGTWEGLNKYDGHKFTRYTTANGLPHSMINDVFEKSSQEMMVVMNDGHISMIRQGRLEPKSRNNKYVINHLLNTREKGLLGVTDSYGVVRLHGDSAYRPGNDHFSLYEIIQWGDYFLAIGDPAPLIVYDRDLQLLGRSDQIPMLTRCIYRDRQDRIWMGTSDGLKIVDLTDVRRPVLKPAPAPFNHPFLAGEVTAIYQDQDGQLWFGTNNGLMRVSESGHSSIFTEREGLPGARITCISADREKNIWIGTFSGLAKLPYQSVDVAAAATGSFFRGPLFDVRLLSDSQLAVTALDAVYRFHTGSYRAHTLLKLETGNVATPVRGSQPFTVIFKNREYVINDQHSAMTPGRTFQTTYIFSAAQQGRLICAGHAGVSVLFDDGKVVQVLDSVRMNNVTWDREGRIWAGAWTEGLFRISLDMQERTVSRIEHISAVPANEHIRALMEDRHGNIWIGTRYQGIIVLTEKKDGSFETRRITQASGLMSDWIYSFAEGNDGSIWAGTLTGISKIIPAGDAYRIFNFSRAVDFYSAANSLAVSSDDRFWGSSDRGLFTFRDLQLERTAPLPVYFTNIKLGNTDSNFAVVELRRKIRLKFDDNYLRFEFTSPGFLNENELMYSYRLRGSADTSWSEPSNIHSVEYASLNPGNYVFEVKMKGWNGVYGPSSAFPFVINRPFWQSWWFYLATALLVILAAFFIFRYRTKQLLKMQRVRTAIATDLHDDIGSSLTNISILSQLSLDKIHKPELAENFLTRIRSEVQQSSQALDDIIWSVNVRNDSLAETLARMRRFAGDMFDDSNTACHLQIDEDFSARRLNMALRRDLYLIYKEIINNARKHSAAQNLWVRISGSEDRIRLEVKDDGKGFDNSRVSERNGLKNLKYRVAKWKGTLKIESGRGNGSTILVILPLKE